MQRLKPYGLLGLLAVPAGPAVAALCTSLLLAGCATSVVDDNFATLGEFGRQRLGSELRWLRSEEARHDMMQEVEGLLASPLGADEAVRIALGYSPALQVLLAEAAAASADATQSARIANPVFTFERLVRNGHDGRELELGRTLGISLFDILLLPARRERAAQRQETTRLQASVALVTLVADVRRAWVRAVSANQVARYRQDVADAAQAAAELARRMEGAGNFSRLQRARQQAFHSDAVAELARSQQQAAASREALIRFLGLPAAQAARLKLPDRLPDLPAVERDEKEVTQAALDERLDVRLARAELEATARELGLTRVTSVVNGLHVAGIDNRETGERRQRGFEVELPLPLFDFGDASRAGAEARYLAALNRTAQVGAEAASQVRESHAAWRTTQALARHYRDEIVPLRQTISDEMVLQYNGMLTDVFELLADARSRITSVIHAIEAERDFWLADATLDAALLGTPVAPFSLQGLAPSGDAGGGGH
ncbi:TolC family protein [Aromatoleum toluclasticum]|uniref:TolC family protein n=1 Tax=Aromatoleum toluclasticum TaxID=92003 RepID=UPI0003820E27|nr:TolC family protein [Aromatoleum toluclasticum]